MTATTKHTLEEYPWVERRTILRGLVGSTAHGLHTDDGSDDRDEMGVCIEPMDAMIGDRHFEQMIYRTAAEREGKHDAKSYAGDLDLTIYSLNKWARLALQGNPTVLLLLFLPADLCTVRASIGVKLQQMSDAFASREAGRRFRGYLQAQRQRMLGERGSLKVHRPELVDKYGYDTKFAMHLLRLGYQGIEFLETGKLTLPMPEAERTLVRSVRVGGLTQEDVLKRASEMEAHLTELIEQPGPLPEHADSERVWSYVRELYLEWWKCDAFDAMVAAGMKR